MTVLYRLGIAASGCALCFMLPAGAHVAGVGDTWPMFRGSPLLWSVSGTQLPGTLKLRRNFQAKVSFESSPAVVGGTVQVGLMDRNLCELDPAIGKKNWEFAAGAQLSASPAAARGALVIGSQDDVL
jgi:hypothetical protein